MKRRVTYRPSKANGAFGMVVGIIFVLIGLVVVIPTFGPFGILWTLMALGITVANGYHAFGSKYVGPEIRIEDEEPAAPAQPVSTDAKARLEQLEELKHSGLITQAEYEEKRNHILNSL